jgi:archaellum biogenesis ATPase FlaH
MSEAESLTLRTADALAADESLAGDVEWVVEDLIPRGGLSVLYGLPKSGKSSFLAYLAACVVSGRSCLERTTELGHVVWFDLEQHVRLTRRKFIEMNAIGYAHSVYIYNGPQPTFEQFCLALAEIETKLVVVDSLSRLLPIEDENAAAETTYFLDQLVQLAHARNLAIVGIHHERKSGGDHGTGMRGSSAFLAVSDVAIRLHRAQGDPGSPKRVLECLSRYDEANTKVVCYRDGASYVAEGSYVPERRKNILKVLSHEWLDVTALHAKVGGDLRAVQKDLRYLVTQEQVSMQGDGKKGDPFLYRRRDV